MRDIDRMESVGARRDPEFIRANQDKLAFYFERYHHVTVEGFENVPDGPTLAVGNHNGGIMSPDMFGLMFAWWRHFGADDPAYGLAHDLGFRLPVLGEMLARAGGVPARQDNARALLDRGARVLVYPGGDLDAYRPWAHRHRIVWGERKGFIRVALRSGVPIVPIVSAGAHEAFRVLSDGRRLVAALGLKRISRIEVFPIALCLPWGITAGPAFFLPMPVRVKIRVLPPLRWPELGPDAADDDAIVRRCRSEVHGVMQSALDELSRDRSLGARLRPR